MTVRRATPEDAPELVRLRRVMYDAMDVDHSDPVWAVECEALFRRALGDGSMVAFVVDGPDARPVACGVGMLAQRLSSPRSPHGVHGHIQSMATDPDHRGNGYARAVFEALLGWFVEQGVDSVDLHASKYGESLYRSLGFAEHRMLALVWRPTPTERPSP